MAPGIGAAGIMGIAFETVEGTYVAPTKFVPFTSESLEYKQSTVFRRVIRGVADIVGAVQGNSNVEGDIEMELLEDVFVWFLYASRNTVVKSGTTNFTYTATPTHSALPVATRTLSLTIVRNGVVFAYTGIRVGSMEFSVNDGLLMVKLGVVGLDEAVQSAPTPTFTTTVPFGAGQYDIQVPTATSVFDTDQFTLNINDNPDPQWRLRNNTRAPSYIKFGEREVGLTLERDFDSRVDYDAFKALTAQSVTIVCSKGTNNKVTFKVPANIKDTYPITNGGEGDLVRASIQYKGVYDPATSKAYEIVVLTQEAIV